MKLLILSRCPKTGFVRISDIIIKSGFELVRTEIHQHLLSHFSLLHSRVFPVYNEDRGVLSLVNLTFGLFTSLDCLMSIFIFCCYVQ